jgi:sigma54-dependent transcription regulator
VNVRIIAATNKEISKEVAAKRFRQDLYSGLNVIAIPMPSLRERLQGVLCDRVPAGGFRRLGRLRGESRGKHWHKKHREQGMVPHSSIDTEAGWSKSG